MAKGIRSKPKDKEEKEPSIYVTNSRLMPSFNIAIKDEPIKSMPKLIAQALCKVQKELKNPPLTERNPYYNSKYSPLSEVLKAVRPILNKHGLILVQDTGGNGLEVFVQTLLIHEEGEVYASSKLFLHPAKDTPQGMAAATTYGKRYQLTSMLGITGEEDDDGNSSERKQAKEERKKERQKEREKAVKKEKSSDKVKDSKQKSEKKSSKKETEKKEKEEVKEETPSQNFGNGIKEEVGGIS